MPIVLQIYNLPPDVPTHLAKILCPGVIPGPRAPKDLCSFLFPFKEECILLATGVQTFHAIKQWLFLLHAYNIFPQGDIIAIEKFLNTKGHNGITPCRGCKIKAVRGCDKTYYVPLISPGGQRTCDPSNLPLRLHGDWATATLEIACQDTVINIDNFKGDFNESCTLNIPNNGKILEIGHAKRYCILFCFVRISMSIAG
jgi:hypothetical protein